MLDFLEATEHRPWPLPNGRWHMFMRWSGLAFLHWRVDPAALAARLPPGLELDTFHGDAWIGVVPFRMEGVRHRWSPALRAFPEINVRTYVRAADRAGVWFFSLDAASRPAVRGARVGLNMPYFDAAMSMQIQDDVVTYRSRRTHRGVAPAVFEAQCSPSGEAYRARPGTLEYWLTERYCFFGQTRRGRPYSVDVHHLPWPLQAASVTLVQNTMIHACGVPLPDDPPLAHYAAAIDVVAWPPVCLRA